jgi:hypothetical protein
VVEVAVKVLLVTLHPAEGVVAEEGHLLTLLLLEGVVVEAVIHPCLAEEVVEGAYFLGLEEPSSLMK